jgi:exosome complex protein LRP1
MTDIKDITPDLDRLDVQLEGLEEALDPLLNNLEEMSSQLPLLDKAKLFSLTAYAIESLLYSSLKLEGIDAQNHEVFTELKRIQQYFGKIKTAEEPEASRNVTVNQEATARVLKANLADNKLVASKLAEKIAEERAKALLKSMETKKRQADGPPPPAGESSNGPQQGKKHKTHKKDRNHHKKKKGGH